MTKSADLFLKGHNPFTLTDFQNTCYGLSLKSGWWGEGDKDNKYIIGTKLCLIHSEISEAMEGHRKGQMDKHLTARRAVEVELADALIRIFDLAGALDLDLEFAIIDKLRYNQERADHKPEARAAAGGKSY